jgi:hypothetical protein
MKMMNQKVKKAIITIIIIITTIILIIIIVIIKDLILGPNSSTPLTIL